MKKVLFSIVAIICLSSMSLFAYTPVTDNGTVTVTVEYPTILITPPTATETVTVQPGETSVDSGTFVFGLTGAKGITYSASGTWDWGTETKLHENVTTDVTGGKFDDNTGAATETLVFKVDCDAGLTDGDYTGTYTLSVTY